MRSVRTSLKHANAARSMSTGKPTIRPACPNFSSGPTAKFPGYSLAALPERCFGRSHRSKVGKAVLKQVIEDQRRLLGIPDDYKVAIMAASDTGAYEAAMWNLLGPRTVDVCYWESFGKGWNTDAETHLKLDQRTFSAPYGELPDLAQTHKDHDICFTWNGTTSGVRVPNADWIANDRTGLTLCDATSAVFAMPLDWSKLDVTTWSWQKALGGEGGHGMIALSPNAVERLLTYTPEARPLPKIFRMTKKGQLDEALFEGSVINTPSMLAAEDCLAALAWAQSIGGLPGMIERSKANLATLESFVDSQDWISFLAKDPSIRSSTSICLNLDLSKEAVKKMTALLEAEGVAFDIGSYRDAPSGLRIWGGSTVETADIAALCEWMKWAYDEVKEQ